MPPGKSFDHGYGSSAPEGMGYREIAEKMTKAGDKMNHSTARNVLLRALEKLAQPIVDCMLDDNEKDAIVVARDPRFQSSMIAMLQDIYE